MVDKAESPDLVPAEMSGAYHRGRRSYGFFSGLLIAWELIGVEIPADPFKELNITLKSPEAAPYVLIALVLYFAFRTSIEWKQCDPKRRVLPASRVDFGAAHVLGAAAIVLYGVQRILEVQVAEYFGQSYSVLSFVGFFGLILGVYSSILVRIWITDRKRGIGSFDFIKNNWGVLTVEITLIIGSLFIIVGLSREGVMERLSYLFLGVLVGVTTILGIRFRVQSQLSHLRQTLDLD